MENNVLAFLHSEILIHLKKQLLKLDLFHPISFYTILYCSIQFLLTLYRTNLLYLTHHETTLISFSFFSFFFVSTY